MLYRNCFCSWALFAIYGLFILAGSAQAYVGPGSGVEFIGYFMTLLAWVFAAFSTMLLWPLYSLIRRFRGKKSSLESQPEAQPKEINSSVT